MFFPKHFRLQKWFKITDCSFPFLYYLYKYVHIQRKFHEKMGKKKKRTSVKIFQSRRVLVKMKIIYLDYDYFAYLFNIKLNCLLIVFIIYYFLYSTKENFCFFLLILKSKFPNSCVCSAPTLNILALLCIASVAYAFCVLIRSLLY